MLTREELHKQLKYDAEQGFFTWLKVHPGVTHGARAGTITSRGYVVIRVNRAFYGAHRLAWLYMTGVMPDEVDHKDLNPSNNAWNNLRLATHAQNAANQKLNSANKSGVKGVNWNKKLGKWCAEIKINGIRHFLGYYDKIEDAAFVRRAFADRMLGEFARHE